MSTTVEQNKAHRADSTWIKTRGKSFNHQGEHYISEYLNAFTGQAIRKSWRMTNTDWNIFDADGELLGREHSLTWAKIAADGYVDNPPTLRPRPYVA